MRWPWKKRIAAVVTEKELPPVVAGQLWHLTINSHENDPFLPKQEPVLIQILEVRDGWVRYYIGDVFPDERLPISRFVACYTLYTPFNVPYRKGA